MFFWMVLASLLGIVMFGNLTEKIKDQNDFVVPVYEAMALNLLQQHAAAERGYAMALKNKPTELETYLNTEQVDDLPGVHPLAVVSGEDISGGSDDNMTIYPLIRSYLPATFKPQNGTRSYFFCVDKNQSEENGDCSSSKAVKYIVTIRKVPHRYEGANRMTALKSIAKVSAHSRFFGILERAPQPLTGEEGDIRHQPIGAVFYIKTAGVAPAGSVYVPNYITCHFPLDSGFLNEDIGSDKTYMISLSLLSGLGEGENLPAGYDPCWSGGA